MAVTLLSRKIVKKLVKQFKRPQSDCYKCLVLKPSWRRLKGMDSRVRRMFKGSTLMSNIGYGFDRKTRHYLPNKFKKFVVHNISELELLMMHNRTYGDGAAEEGFEGLLLAVSPSAAVATTAEHAGCVQLRYGIHLKLQAFNNKCINISRQNIQI